MLKTSAPTSSYLFPFLFDSTDRDIPHLLNSTGPGVLFLCDDSIIIQPVAMMTCPASSAPLQFRHRRALPLVRSLPYRRAKQPVNSNCLRFLSVSLGAKKIGSCLKGPFSITCTPSSSIPGRKFETVTEEFIVSISLVTNFYRGWTFPGSNILHLWDLSHTYFVGRSSSRL